MILAARRGGQKNLDTVRRRPLTFTLSQHARWWLQIIDYQSIGGSGVRPRNDRSPGIAIGRSAEVLCELAEIFRLTPNEVHEVASFYTMLFRKPVGRYVIWVCTNISCMLCGAEGILAHLESRLGIRPGETTPDGRFTLMEAECLASCGTAPVVQINDDYYENLTLEKLDRILDGLT